MVARKGGGATGKDLGGCTVTPGTWVPTLLGSCHHPSGIDRVGAALTGKAGRL